MYSFHDLSAGNIICHCNKAITTCNAAQIIIHNKQSATCAMVRTFTFLECFMLIIHTSFSLLNLYDSTFAA